MSAIQTRTNASTTVDSETTRSAFTFSGNFPEPFRTLLTRSARPERTTRRPRASHRVPRARPGHPPRRPQPWFETKSHPSRRAGFRKKRTRRGGVQVFRKLSGHFPDTFDAHFSARADDAAPARIQASPSRAPVPPAAPSPAVGRAEKSPVSSSRAFPEKTNPRVGVQLFRKLSGNSRRRLPRLHRRPRAPERVDEAPAPTFRAFFSRFRSTLPLRRTFLFPSTRR